MPSNLDVLLEMGFSQNRAEKALAATDNYSFEAAVDWLMAHSDDPDIDEPYQAPQGHLLGSKSESTENMEEAQAQPEEGETEPKENESSTTAASASNGSVQDLDDSSKSTEDVATKKSIKCDECGKLFVREDAIQTHAFKTGHQSFSESTEEVKPLTEEEKLEQKLRLEQIIKERREKKMEQEKKEQLEREKLRRKQGKDVVSSKQRMQEMEMKKIAEERKKEKLEDQRARQRVKEQIAKDREDRKQRDLRNQNLASSASVTTSQPTTASVQQQPKKEYDKCRLQIRLPTGQSLTQQFGVKEQLAAVRLYVQMNRPDGSTDPFALMTTFPKRVFTEEDMEKPLSELNLVPSAVVLVTKPT